MKVNTRIIILLIFSMMLFCSKSVAANLPTDEQVQKLAAAAWKERPHSIDVTLYKEIIKPPTSEEEFRQMFEEFFEKAEGPKENLSPQELEMRNRDIQLNVERALKEQEAGRKIKQRIRIDGFRQRIDQVIAWPKMVLLEGTPHEKIRPEVIIGPNTPYDMTLVNSGDKRKGDYISFAYYNANKSARITNNRKSMWKRSDITDFAVLASLFQGFLGVNEGTISEPFFAPDPNKMDELRKTGLVAGVLCLTIDPDPNNPGTRDRVEIKSTENPCGTVMICDRNDYSRVYYLDICNSVTGKPLYVREFDKFDSLGFPHHAIVTEYDSEGGFKKREVYTIEKIELNPGIPDDVFEFNPPKDYEVVDLRPESSKYAEKVKSEVEALETLKSLHKVSDIPELKNMLKHESWKVRLTALRIIGGLPIEDLEVLIDVATSMKKDGNPLVQKEADRILQRVESNK